MMKMSTKFAEEAHDGLISVVFKKSESDGHTHTLTDGPTEN